MDMEGLKPILRPMRVSSRTPAKMPNAIIAR